MKLLLVVYGDNPCGIIACSWREKLENKGFTSLSVPTTIIFWSLFKSRWTLQQMDSIQHKNDFNYFSFYEIELKLDDVEAESHSQHTLYTWHFGLWHVISLHKMILV